MCLEKGGEIGVGVYCQLLPFITIMWKRGRSIMPIITRMQCGHLNLFTSKQLDIINSMELIILQESLWDKLQIIIFINYAWTSWK